MKSRKPTSPEFLSFKYFVLSDIFVNSSHLLDSFKAFQPVLSAKHPKKSWDVYADEIDENLSNAEYPVPKQPHVIYANKPLSYIGGFLSRNRSTQWNNFLVNSDTPMHAWIINSSSASFSCESVNRRNDRKWVNQIIASCRIDNMSISDCALLDVYVSILTRLKSRLCEPFNASITIDSLYATHGGIRYSTYIGPGFGGGIMADVLFLHRDEHKSLLGKKFSIPAWGYILSKASMAKLDMKSLRAKCVAAIEEQDSMSMGVQFTVDDIIRPLGESLLLTSSKSVAQGMSSDVEWIQSKARIAAIFWSHLHKAGLTL